jgi:hypothetical protein
MPTEKLLGYTKNNQAIYFGTDSGHAATHFANQPNLETVVQATLKEINASGASMRSEYDTQTIIGNTDLVETSELDSIFYAIRKGRTTYSRFCTNKSPRPTSWITLDIRRRNDGHYSLYTAFIGRLTPSFPGGDCMPEKSKNFWSQHALAFGTQEIIPKTKTLMCPW